MNSLLWLVLAVLACVSRVQAYPVVPSQKRQYDAEASTQSNIVDAEEMKRDDKWWHQKSYLPGPVGSSTGRLMDDIFRQFNITETILKEDDQSDNKDI